MSEKPFWAGKTLMEIQNLDKRVKVTMENGDVFIGKLIRRSRDTDGICSLSMQLDAHRTYLHVFSAESSDTPPVIPSYVDTIELVDDPEYERIEKAAIAIFAAQTNWTEPNPTQKTVKALWDGQMDAVRDSFRRLAKAALDSLEDRPADLDWENAEPKETTNE